MSGPGKKIDDYYITRTLGRMPLNAFRCRIYTRTEDDGREISSSSWLNSKLKGADARLGGLLRKILLVEDPGTVLEEDGDDTQHSRPEEGVEGSKKSLLRFGPARRAGSDAIVRIVLALRRNLRLTFAPNT